MEKAQTGIGLALSAALLTSCSAAPESETPEPIPTGNPTNIVPAEDIAQRKMPYDSCPPTNLFGRKEYEAEATKCTVAMASGKIALVSYGLKPKVMKRLAKDAETLFNTSGAGLMDIRIIPVSPNEEAKTTFEERDEDCIPVNDEFSWGGYIANEADPSLDEYDYVIGASKLPSCGGSGSFDAAHGLASIMAGGRFVELTQAENVMPQPNKVTEISTDMTQTELQQFDASVVAHELFHAYGLGHANRLVFTGNDKLADLGFESNAKLKQLDLLKHLAQGQFEEYGGYDSIMGSTEPDITTDYPTHNLLNEIQLALLDKPNVILGKSKNQFAEVKQAPTLVEADEIYTFKLPRALKAADFKQGTFTEHTDGGANSEYTKVVFVPLEDDDLAHANFAAYLLSNDNDTLDVGYLFNSPNTTWKLGLGDKTITVAPQNGRTAISFK